MFKQRFAPVLAIALALFAPAVHAYFDPPWITPAQPREGEAVRVSIHGGLCDAIISHPGNPQIELDGTAIRIIVDGVHQDSIDWCIYGEWTVTYPLGEFPSGDRF